MPELNPYEAPQTIDNDNSVASTLTSDEEYGFRRWMIFLIFLQVGLIQIAFNCYESNQIYLAIFYGAMATILTAISVIVSIVKDSWSWFIIQGILLLTLRYLNS